jgi:hypothetical protein
MLHPTERGTRRNTIQMKGFSSVMLKEIFPNGDILVSTILNLSKAYGDYESKETGTFAPASFQNWQISN